MNGLKKHYGEHPSPEVLERLRMEISVITQMGYVDYFPDRVGLYQFRQKSRHSLLDRGVVPVREVCVPTVRALPRSTRCDTSCCLNAS